MGGTSFLLNKKFHPARLDNQKKVFIAEEKSKEKKKREEEAAKEVLKEREALYYENLGQIQVRDARQSSLKFMYSAPSVNGKASSSSASSSSSSSQDPAVVAFYAKIHEKRNSSSSSNNTAGEISHEEVKESSLAPPSERIIDHIHQKRDPMSNPLLKNAPREGNYVKNMTSAAYKPFHEKLRHVQCSLCGEWGHRFGDRECRLRDYNPHDQARLLREDPMTYFKEKLPQSKQQMVLTEAAGKRKTMELTSHDDDDEESDPEAEFLATLTPREKKLLLRKLRILQGEEVPPISDSDSSSSTDDSESDDGHKRKKHKSEKKKSKHKHKHNKDKLAV